MYNFIWNYNHVSHDPASVYWGKTPEKCVTQLWNLLGTCAYIICRMLQSSLANSSSSAIEQRLSAVSERLREIERRKTAVDDRQDDIDKLAFETIATMVDMQVRKLDYC